MNKLIIGLLLIIVLMPNVAGIGLSPPQLRVTEAPIGTNTYVATISTVNTGDEPAYMILKISCLAKTREHKLRVVCNGCSREIGIQRGDLINESCPFCNSTNLIYYDFPPDDILDSINLACKDHPLEKIENRMYKTEEKIQPNEAANIDIYLNISDIKEYYNQHWEARIMAISVIDMEDLSKFIVYGIEAKFLIDTPVLIEKTVTKMKEEDNTFIFLGLGLIGISILVVVGIFFFKSRKKDVLIHFPETSSKKKTFKKIAGGKRLL